MPLRKPKPLVSIHIGEYHASRLPNVIHTTLGSCVAACLYDPVARAGGMNHILLPGSADLTRFDEGARYGINAMELLLNALMKQGARRSRLSAKIFGGAHLLPAISVERGPGRKNAEFVEAFLEQEGIPVVAKDLGGFDSRKIYFHTDTGEVLLKRTPSAANPRLAALEQKTRRKIRRKAVDSGGITLFRPGGKDLER